MSAIQAGLDTLLDVWATAESVPVKWENFGSGSDITVLHVAPFILPAEIAPVGVGDNDPDDNTGIYQISVYSEKGIGTKAARDAITTLKPVFAKGVKAGIVRIEKTWESAGFDDEAWYIVPVSVRYRCIQ